jgi:5-methylcytosine-specific restriction protein A
VYDNGWKPLEDEDPRVAELSELLQNQQAHPPEVRKPDFRNRNSVARKTSDIATRHPDYTGVPTNGGRYDREVLSDLLADPARMLREAEAIRRQIVRDADKLPIIDVDLDGCTADEGQVLRQLHLRRERDPHLRRKVIQARKGHGEPIVCEACGFDFRATYGERGADYIECHHRVPLHASGPTTTRVQDLALLCANCHRMIHRTAPWLTVEELIDLLKGNHRS